MKFENHFLTKEWGRNHSKQRFTKVATERNLIFNVTSHDFRGNIVRHIFRDFEKNREICEIKVLRKFHVIRCTIIPLLRQFTI